MCCPFSYNHPPPFQYSEHSQYFAASYVKWLESGGARVVPVRYTLPQEEMVALLHTLNGVLFTGGGADFFNSDGTLTPFGAAGKTVVDTVVDMNKKGTYFPLWGAFDPMVVCRASLNCSRLLGF